MDENKKTTIKSPFKYLHLLFGLQAIFVLFIFVIGGYAFFQEDIHGSGILVPLGMITFISIFLGYAYPKEIDAFRTLMKKQEKEFDKELKRLYKTKANSSKISDFASRKKEFEEYSSRVNPLKWFYLSIFLFIAGLLINFVNAKWVVTINSQNIIVKYLVISIFIHFGFVFTLFLLVSILSMIIAQKIIKV